MEATAAQRTIVRRDNDEGYREMQTRMAKESGIETPTAEDLVRLDRNRKGKKLSNADWQSPTDPDADRQVERWLNASGIQARACDGPRYRGGGRGRAARRRPRRHHDHAGHAGKCRRASRGG